MPSYDDDFAWLLPFPAATRSVTQKGRNRDAACARLKALGWSLEDIAEHVGFDRDEKGVQRVTAAIKRALVTMTRFATDEARTLELWSLDELESTLWKELRAKHVLVDRGRIVRDDRTGEDVTDSRFVLETTDRILKVKAQRADLLGLKAPTRTEVLNIDSIDAEIAKLEKELNETESVLADVAAESDGDESSTE